MNDIALLLIWCWPLLLATLAGLRHTGWMTVLAPLPALAVAVVMPVGTSLSLPWLLLGTELGLDETGRTFLLFSSLLWLAASLYGIRETAAGHKGVRYRVFFLLAMAGNLGLIVAQDLLGFYLGFTLMGLAAYGLIADPATRRARRAARRYLVWTIAGELLLFVALVMLAMQHGGALLFSMLSSMHASLKPGGILIIIDFRRDPRHSSRWVMGHVRAGKDTVIEEVTDAGFGLVDDLPLLRTNYYLVFRKLDS